MKIAVLGAGTWGTALAVKIARNSTGDPVWLWGRNNYTTHLKNLVFPENLYFSTDLDSTMKHANDLLIAVPSNALRNLINRILPALNDRNKSYRMILATKGMDAETQNFFSEIIKNLVHKDLPIAILSGPSFAQEVIDEIPTAVVLAFVPKDQEFANDIFKKINSKNFKIYFNHDLIGVQLGGVFKNVLAVATGICDGLGFGANTRSALIARGVAEALRLAEHLPADPKTLVGLAGIGDIILTCCNDQSRNRRFGLLLAKGFTVTQAKKEIGQAIEALDNIEILSKIALSHKIAMPILSSTWKLLHGEIAVITAVDFWLSNENSRIE